MDLSALDMVLSIFLAFIGVVGSGYVFLRFLVKPMISEEIDKVRDWFIKYEEKEHERIEKEIDRERKERTFLYANMNDNLVYIREKVDRIAEKLIPMVS